MPVPKPAAPPAAKKFTWNDITVKPTKKKPEQSLSYRDRLRMLAWDESFHPRDESGKFTSGGGGDAVARPEKEELLKREQAARDATDAFIDAKSAFKDTQREMEKRYGKFEDLFDPNRSTPVTDEDVAKVDALDAKRRADPEFAAAREKVNAAQRAMEKAELAVKEQHPPVRQEAAQIAVNVVAARQNFDPRRVDVVDKVPREFEVAGRKLNEGGHYNPATGRIQVNARAFFDAEDPSVQGLVAHEVMHAQEDTVVKVARAEHDDIRTMWADDRTIGHGEMRDAERLFMRNGFPRTSRIPEIEQRWPASAAMAKTAPTGDSYLGTWSQGEDGKWAFDEKAYKDDGGRREQMEKDDGITPYSKLYWEAYHAAPEGSAAKSVALHRAEQETLAEVAAYHDRAPRGRWSGSVPSKAWQDHSLEVQRVYPTIKDKPQGAK